MFVITPAEGPARRVEIAVRDSAGENEVADIVRDGLKDAIGDDYRVEVDDGEDVLVKRRWFRPRFNIALAENTIDVRINFDQE